MGAVGRLFVGVDLAAEVRHALAARLAGTVEGRLPGKVVPPPNWHLTLRFLGDVDQVGRDRLLMALAGADLGSAFDMTLTGLGAFPRPAKAAVLWAGVADGSVALGAVASRVEEACREAGFGPEERPFHPHLTLSRIRPPEDLTGLIRDVQEFRIRTMVDEVTLFESHLGRGGARYEALERFELDPST